MDEDEVKLLAVADPTRQVQLHVHVCVYTSCSLCVALCVITMSATCKILI